VTPTEARRRDALERYGTGGVRRDSVPDEINLKVEFEIEDDGTELEIELTW
jgi:hypothetical protein